MIVSLIVTATIRADLPTASNDTLEQFSPGQRIDVRDLVKTFPTIRVAWDQSDEAEVVASFSGENVGLKGRFVLLREAGPFTSRVALAYADLEGERPISLIGAGIDEDANYTKAIDALNEVFGAEYVGPDSICNYPPLEVAALVTVFSAAVGAEDAREVLLVRGGVYGDKPYWMTDEELRQFARYGEDPYVVQRDNGCMIVYRTWQKRSTLVAEASVRVAARQLVGMSGEYIASEEGEIRNSDSPR